METLCTRNVRCGAGFSAVLYLLGVREQSLPRIQSMGLLEVLVEKFGFERLGANLRRHATQPLDNLKAAIEIAVDDFPHGAPQADDITLLLARYEGSSQE